MALPATPFFTDCAQTQLDELLMLVCEDLQLAPYRHALAAERYESVTSALESTGSPFSTSEHRF